MDWREHIVSNQKVLGGKPAVVGTRLAVDFILGLYANGWTTDEVLRNYPSLTADSLKAVFAYAAEVMQNDTVYPLPAASS